MGQYRGMEWGNCSVNPQADIPYNTRFTNPQVGNENLALSTNSIYSSFTDPQTATGKYVTSIQKTAAPAVITTLKM